MPAAARQRVEAAVAAEVEREVLRRTAGPVIPLRGLRLGDGRDLEAEVRAIRQRGERADGAKQLGLHELGAEELERLLEMARS